MIRAISLIFIITLLFAADAHAEDGVFSDRVVIGQSINTSGPTSENSKSLMSGSRVYFNRINASGGVNGRKIVVNYLDDGYEPSRAADNARKMIEEQKVFALFNFHGSPIAKAVLPIVEKSRLPFLFPNTGLDELRNPVNPHIFTVRGGFFEESERMVKHAVDVLKKKSIGVFYQDDAFGIAGKNGIAKALSTRGLHVAQSASYKRNELKVVEQAKELMKAKVDVVFIWAVFKQGAHFIKTARELGWKVEIIGSSNLSSETFFSEGGAALEGTWVTQVLPLPDDMDFPIIQQFNADMKAAKEVIDGFSESGYIHAVLFVEALKRAGKGLTRDRLRSTLEAMKNVDIGGLSISYSAEKHFGLDKVYLTRVKNGRFVKEDIAPAAGR